MGGMGATFWIKSLPQLSTSMLVMTCLEIFSNDMFIMNSMKKKTFQKGFSVTFLFTSCPIAPRFFFKVEFITSIRMEELQEFQHTYFSVHLYIWMQHCCPPATNGAEFWIICKRPAFLSSFSRLQEIQNKPPWCWDAAYVTAGYRWKEKYYTSPL